MRVYRVYYFEGAATTSYVTFVAARSYDEAEQAVRYERLYAFITIDRVELL